MEPAVSQGLAVVIGNLVMIIPLWLWNRAESRADSRHMDTRIDSNRQLIFSVHEENRKMHEETRALISSIHDEMKDFHYRLLEIEKSRRVV